MSPKKHFLHLRRESFKFSSAHMTVMPDGTKETLHGHNYTVNISFQLKDGSGGETVPFGQMVPFKSYKEPVEKVCEAWDEKVLLPAKCPYFRLVTQSAEEIEFLLCNKRYVLPSEDVALLPVENVTVEALSQHFCHCFLSYLEPGFVLKTLASIEVFVEESPGRGASFFWQPEPDPYFTETRS